MTAESTITLERDDMQAALLHARPTRYAGAVLLGRIDNRRDGRELLRRLIPFIPTAAGSPEPDQVAWAAVGLSFQGLKAQPGVDGARPVQDGYCIAPSGETARFCVHDEQGGRGGGLRVYAGLRSDPFFIDLPAWLESLKTGRLAFKQEGQNSLTGANILGVVVEVDGKLLLKNGGPPLFAVVAETVVDGKLPVRIERFGRPEVKNHLLSMKEFDQVNRDLEVRDLYNLEGAFHMSKDYRGVYRARLNANLTVIDRLDGKTDWPLGPDGAHPLTEPAARRLPGGGRLQAVRRGQLLRDRTGGHAGTPARDVRCPLAQRERDGHHIHAARQRRQRTAHQRWRGPGDDAGV
jgi:hypothetical protein